MVLTPVLDSLKLHLLVSSAGAPGWSSTPPVFQSQNATGDNSPESQNLIPNPHNQHNQ